MPPKVVHELWTLIDLTQTNLLLGLSDSELAHWLTQQLQKRGILSKEEVKACRDYILNRLPLIRELAHDRNLICSH